MGLLYCLSGDPVEGDEIGTECGKHGREVQSCGGKERERTLIRLGVDGRIILKWILNGTGNRELVSCGS